MQAELVDLALEHGSSVLAEHLKASAKAHGSARLTAVTLKMVDEQAALLAVAKPEATHSVGMWFRPLVTRRLNDAGIRTLVELVEFCNRRGGSWWCAIPRIGPGRAQHIHPIVAASTRKEDRRARRRGRVVRRSLPCA